MMINGSSQPGVKKPFYRPLFVPKGNQIVEQNKKTCLVTTTFTRGHPKSHIILSLSLIRNFVPIRYALYTITITRMGLLWCKMLDPVTDLSWGREGYNAIIFIKQKAMQKCNACAKKTQLYWNYSHSVNFKTFSGFI